MVVEYTLVRYMIIFYRSNDNKKVVIPSEARTERVKSEYPLSRLRRQLSQRESQGLRCFLPEIATSGYRPPRNDMVVEYTLVR